MWTGSSDAGRRLEHGAVEGELVQVAEGAGVELEAVHAVAGLQVDDARAARGIDPVDPRLARVARVLGAHDALGDAVLRGATTRSRGGRTLADISSMSAASASRERGLAQALGPLGERLRAAAVGKARLRVHRPADGELRLEALAALEDQDVRGAARRRRRRCPCAG
jgi:hypothetical protein